MMARQSIFAAAAFLLLAGTGHARAGGKLWLNEDDIMSLRKQPARTAGLIQRCDKELGMAATPSPDLAPPPHYSAAGMVHDDTAKAFVDDGRRAFRAGLCYLLSQDQRYAKASQATLSAWGNTLRTVSSDQGVAEVNFNLEYYVLAASMVRGVNGWNDESFRRMLTKVALPLAPKHKNNHQNWEVFRDASIAAYLGDAALLERARERWLQLMENQVAADGSLPLETCRSDTNNYCGGDHQGINGISYTHYTLMPTTAAARIFELQGRAVWQTPQGARLAAAYRKAASWTLHPETFPYYASNGGKLNGVSNAAYFLLLQRQYPNDDAAQVIRAGRLSMDALEWQLLFGGAVQ